MRTSLLAMAKSIYYSKIAHMRVFRCEHFKYSPVLYCISTLFGKKVKPQNEWWNVELFLRGRDLDCVVNKHTACLELQKAVDAPCNGL